MTLFSLWKRKRKIKHCSKTNCSNFYVFSGEKPKTSKRLPDAQPAWNRRRGHKCQTSDGPLHEQHQILLFEKNKNYCWSFEKIYKPPPIICIFGVIFWWFFDIFWGQNIVVKTRFCIMFPHSKNSPSNSYRYGKNGHNNERRTTYNWSKTYNWS